jgi:DNA-binding NarL/FixJ family response regulator
MKFSHSKIIRIVLADDHRIVRQGIRSLLENETDFQVIGEAGDGSEALEMVNRLSPDILVTDLSMPYYSGIEIARKIKASRLQTRIVILSMHKDEPYILHALESGASCYLLKDFGIEHVATAIRHAMAGRRYVSPPLSMPTLN